MGRSAGNGGLIVFVPGRGGGETIAAGTARRGETISQTLARVTRGQALPRGAQYLPLSGDDVNAYGGRTGFSDADIRDFTGQLGGARSVGRRLVEGEARGVRAGGAGRLAAEETRAAARERNAPRRAAQTAARVSALQAERRQALARVRQLQAAGRSQRTISQAQRQADSLRQQINEVRAAGRARG